MKLFYDKDSDCLYIEFQKDKCDGVIELEQGINLDVTPENKITGIEILHASKRLDLKTILSYSINEDLTTNII